MDRPHPARKGRSRGARLAWVFSAAVILALGNLRCGGSSVADRSPRPAGGAGSDSGQRETAENLVVQIGNLSSFMDPVEVHLFLDGVEVVREQVPFRKEDGDTTGKDAVKEFRFELLAGPHVLRASVPALGESSERELTIGADRTYAAFSFFYSVSKDEKGSPSIRKSLEWKCGDKSVLFR